MAHSVSQERTDIFQPFCCLFLLASLSHDADKYAAASARVLATYSRSRSFRPARAKKSRECDVRVGASARRPLALPSLAVTTTTTRTAPLRAVDFLHPPPGWRVYAAAAKGLARGCCDYYPALLVPVASITLKLSARGQLAELGARVERTSGPHALAMRASAPYKFALRAGHVEHHMPRAQRCPRIRGALCARGLRWRAPRMRLPALRCASSRARKSGPRSRALDCTAAPQR
ncbi:hypothetical protein FB451DRAFT_1409758 [Mycena latifolia]|nr:hypothetical protein FB451DRAFT_1409758 [Mycena latifolia]